MEDQPTPPLGAAVAPSGAVGGDADGDLGGDLGGEVGRDVGGEVDNADIDVLALVEGAAQSVRSIGDAPLEEHAERYQAVHAILQGALSDNDLRDSG